MSCCLW